MATTIIMPKLGMAMAEGVVAQWLKHDGDEVKANEEIAVIMSKKITYKLKSPAAGILRTIVKDKEPRPINSPLAYVVAPGEAIPAGGAAVPAPAAAAVPAPTGATATATGAPATSTPAKAGGFVAASPAARRVAKEQSIDLSQVPGTGADGLVTEADVNRFIEAAAKAADALATSAARKLAEQKGLKLTDIPGTGAGGRITEQDVLDFEARAQAPAPVPAAAAPAKARVIPFAGMRQSIAEHMVESPPLGLSPRYQSIRQNRRSRRPNAPGAKFQAPTYCRQTAPAAVNRQRLAAPLQLPATLTRAARYPNALQPQFARFQQ